ncbi:TatD family deoxyribonuclease [Marinomonas rhizomae]|uniref:TatD DNase family protein n=1 Tax=Marinomonas rhizomae TaxID=491948 RepID=A0A366JCT4_9GAMM|nr:TatD family hydrolase [Marinomonas rhizomae]RBP84783.1 TatD DNase family protein [Marinomonas rhizomae]RNF75020.1 TatD family deoxyribonuclease [Marinomonas rhizomae]
MLIDTHCHLDMLDLAPHNNDINSVIDAAYSKGVRQLLTISVDLNKMDTVLGFTKRAGIYASCGVHPLQSEGLIKDDVLLCKYAADPKVIAIGETGLDYFYEASEEAHDAQKISFMHHLKAAGDLKLPVIVHTRSAKKETLALIKQYGNPNSAGVLHCFTEDYEMAKAALDENYLISISGIVTFKTAQDLKETVRKLPLESLIVETDSPYLAPVPYRGKKNEPQYVSEVAQYVADLKGIRYEALLEATAANFHRVFTRANPQHQLQLSNL